MFKLITGKREDQKLQIEIEAAPGSGLVLRDGGNYWDVVLGIRGVQK